MAKYIIKLSYDGSAYSGWQIQRGHNTLQQTIQECISILLKNDIKITGAGRTDTTVNATNYVCHFDAPENILAKHDVLIYKLNAMLPKDISISEVQRCPDDFHARFDAKQRCYRYFIHKRKDPFISKYSFLYSFPIDMNKMNCAAELLIGEHDFSCFEKSGSDNTNSICTISFAKWESYIPNHVSLLNYPAQENDYLVFTIKANRFLRNMVRAIVGTLLEIGRGKRDIKDITFLLGLSNNCDDEFLKQKGSVRSMAGESVPGHGLFLYNVDY